MSDVSAGAGAAPTSKATASQREWVTRVLGCRFSDGSGDAAARFEAARPNQPPTAAMTANLLAMMARAAPEAADELPAILSGMVPRFLLAIQNEPPMQAQPLAEGAPVPAQDQVLTLADQLNAVLRSARRWEALLGQAEQADAALDKLQAAERDTAQQQDYEDRVASYNATRAAGLAEETRVMQLVAALSATFRAAQSASAH